MRKIYLLAVLVSAFAFSSVASADVGRLIGKAQFGQVEYHSFGAPSVTFGNFNWNDFLKKLQDFFARYHEQEEEHHDGGGQTGGETGGGYHSVPEINSAGGAIAFALLLGLIGIFRERQRGKAGEV